LCHNRDIRVAGKLLREHIQHAGQSLKEALYERRTLAEKGFGKRLKAPQRLARHNIHQASATRAHLVPSDRILGVRLRSPHLLARLRAAQLRTRARPQTCARGPAPPLTGR
jgi:hypothetical protein